MNLNTQLQSLALNRLAAEQQLKRPESEQSSAGSSANNKGATIIIDNFTSSASHGYKVEGAAQSLGFTGPTYRVSSLQEDNGRPTLPYIKPLKNLQLELSAGPLPEEEVNQKLEEFVTLAAAGQVKLATSHLEALEAQGFQNSVVNLSQGIDAIGLMDMLKMGLGPNSKLSPEQQLQYSKNLSSALLTAEETSHKDEKLMDKRLLQKIGVSLKGSAAVQGAIAGWSEEVKSFESAHNSVIVAAGNSGNAYKALSQAGFELDGSEDFNLLSVPEVTSVGATAQSPNGDLVLASSSSFGPEVDIIASGEYQGSFGTSYAAPKVANLLRAIHLLQPNFTSDQAESFLKETLAQPVELLGTQVGLLSSEKGAYLLNALEKKQQA